MTQSYCATSWSIVSCSGVGSRATWRLWDDGGRHGWWVRGFATIVAAAVAAAKAVAAVGLQVMGTS